ncbi:MAG: hypothetical protein HC822_07310 [Oscillochloris sp.]|nr:hypothetical protein [Oscillochloris sp.]
MSDRPSEGLFLVTPQDGEPLLDAVGRGLNAGAAPTDSLAALSDLAQRDSYLADQLAALRRNWAVQPAVAHGFLGRLRMRLAWRLLGPEIQQINDTHATLVRLLESMVGHLDAERAARARLEARLAERDPS